MKYKDAHCRSLGVMTFVFKGMFYPQFRKTIWLKGLQNTGESAFSHSSVVWMEDDPELSGCSSAHVAGRNGVSPDARGPK